jgi:hypothetical protein
MIVVNATHACRILQQYVGHFNTQWTHLGVGNDSPESREVQGEGEIEKIPVVGGLHHFYYRLVV